ncbi:flagellar hook-basal body protein [Bacillus mesophilum]|uniref:Flagellar hook-basal body protein n=1 Tax=Bacillus mesophilum TaxID=1071718 RepID=A0A7V7RL93_9BACI|nr:flagellar hook-basal body protein [Bacillus mesophilum]KAB2332532.1 flagellar hook-basal body protein [Bacillus mesophilum]
MNRTMITATNTLAQLQKQMDIVSNNVANIDTNGFKRREANFTDLLFQQFNNGPGAPGAGDAGRLTPNGIRQGTGAKLAISKIVMAQGNLKTTDRPLDMALTAEGQVFRVLEQNDNGSAIRYTRDGAFYLTPISQNETMLVTGNGYPVLDENNNPITINAQASNFALSETGRLTVDVPGGGTASYDLGISYVNKPQFLEQKGGNLLGLPENMADLGVEAEEILTELNGPLRNQIGIAQGVLEQSNVDLSKEMTELINLQRSYQFQSRSISMADQMMGLVNGIR